MSGCTSDVGALCLMAYPNHVGDATLSFMRLRLSNESVSDDVYCDSVNEMCPAGQMDH